jgi:hypothetical protein
VITKSGWSTNLEKATRGGARTATLAIDLRPARTSARREAYVKRVLGWTGKAIFEGLVIGAVAGLAGSLLLIVVEPSFVATFVPAEPTCDDPGDLVKVNVLERGDIELEASSVEDLPEGVEDPTGEQWSAAAAFDGKPGTGWVPQRDDEEPTLTLTFDAPVDLQMMCAVNGVASTEWAYRRADRIRTAEVQSLSDARPETNWYRAPLKTMSIDEAQNRQQVRFQAGECSKLTLRITERYDGVTVSDPLLGRYVERTGLVALGELELFEDRQGSRS